MVDKIKQEWFSNTRADVLAGIVVALALIPEAIAFSIIAGVILSAVLFVAKISKIKLYQKVEGSNLLVNVEGPLFFASVESFVNAFDFTADAKSVVINFSNAKVWDDSAVDAVDAIDKVVMKYHEYRTNVTIKGLDSTSKRLVDKLAVYHRSNAKPSAH
ncbi:STAS domain-containing protein [Priestia flexa]|uniref:STAS domain-containing protein n=1 Tax=Priestia flexa TaxID=86664 RepID=UPI003FD22884